MSNSKNVCVLLAIVLLVITQTSADISTAYLSKPNRKTGLERFFGLGVVSPYPYYQKPEYRYPVYDRNGRGSLLYGYGGPETFQYKQFTPIDGHH